MYLSNPIDRRCKSKATFAKVALCIFAGVLLISESELRGESCGYYVHVTNPQFPDQANEMHSMHNKNSHSDNQSDRLNWPFDQLTKSSDKAPCFHCNGSTPFVPVPSTNTGLTRLSRLDFINIQSLTNQSRSQSHRSQVEIGSQKPIDGFYLALDRPPKFVV